MMSELEFNYTGQSRDARRFVVENLVESEKAPFLTDAEVKREIEKYIEKNNLEVVYMDGGQDIYLVSSDLLNNSVSFHR